MIILRKIDYLFSLIRSKCKVIRLKICYKKNLFIEGLPLLKNTTRIRLFGNRGSIVIKDCFSIGYNSELFVWDGKIKIGKNTSINDNCKIYNDVSIGSNCLLASNIFISSGTHNFESNPYLPIKTQDKISPSKSKLITIEDDCWLGFGVVIMPGVYIGKGAVIGANSVVTKDVMPYTINGGVPCKEIKKRVAFQEGGIIDKLEVGKPEHWPFFYRGIDYEQFNDFRCVGKGLKIIEKNSLFLLSKKQTDKIAISGVTTNLLNIEIILNNTLSINKVIPAGSFDLKLSLSNHNKESVETSGLIPESLRNSFSFIEIKIKGNIIHGKDFCFRLKSIGYYED